MDPAENEQLTTALHAQEARLTQQEGFQMALAAQMGQLSSQVRDILDHVRQMTSPPTTPEPLAAAVTPAQPMPLGELA